MKKGSLVVLAVMAVVLGIFLIIGQVWAGEKEDLAIRIFTMQEEIQASQATFKTMQEEYQKLRESAKKEPDKAKKGEMAVKILKMEDDLISMAGKMNQKGEEQQGLRSKFREMVDKELKK